MFEHEGCIEEEREEQRKREKETAAEKEVEIKLVKIKSHKTGRTRKRQKKGTDGGTNSTATGHQNFLSTQPSVSAMARDSLNTLGEVTIPCADKRVIAILLRQQQ